MQAIGPEADSIGQQFNATRQMISQQPRGGHKTSQLAQLPIEQSRELSGLVGQARRGAPAGLEQIAGLLSQLGEQETGRGFAAGPELAQIGLYGRQQDYEQSWGRFFKQQTHVPRSEEHTSELQSRENLVCRLLLEKKKKKKR